MHMFCPKCGKAEQSPESYCRQCGTFLPDLFKPVKRELPPEDHLKANLALSMMTIVVSFILSGLIFTLKPGTHALIYVTAGFLLGIGCWHVQTFIRTWKLRQQWRRKVPLTDASAASQTAPPPIQAAPTAKMLEQPVGAVAQPTSVTEHTTRELVEQKRPR